MSFPSLGNHGYNYICCYGYRKSGPDGSAAYIVRMRDATIEHLSSVIADYSRLTNTAPTDVGKQAQKGKQTLQSKDRPTDSSELLSKCHHRVLINPTHEAAA